MHGGHLAILFKLCAAGRLSAAGSSASAPGVPAAGITSAVSLACRNSTIVDGCSTAVSSAVSLALRLLRRYVVAGFFFGESSCVADAISSAAGFADVVLSAGLAVVALSASSGDVLLVEARRATTGTPRGEA